MLIALTPSANAKFLQTDPAGYKAGMNLYAYVLNDPMNRNDPTGMTDIYIGGAGDSLTRIVGPYATGQQGRGRAVRFFKHNQVKAAVAYAKANAGNGEPMNIIGHSWGGTSATSVARHLGKADIKVDNLVGVDPVGKFLKKGSVGDNVGNIITVNATGKGSAGDAVEGLGKLVGGGKPKAFKAKNANVTITSKASHEQFRALMNASGTNGQSAQQIIDASYKKKDEND